MTNSTEKVLAHIETARVELEETIRHLSGAPLVDPGSVKFAAHALNNFLAVSGGCVALLSDRLQDYRDPEVQTWLRSLEHVTDLMSEVSNSMMNATAAAIEFRPEAVDCVTLVERCCNFHQRIANAKKIRILFEANVEEGIAHCDRVALAAVLDNLLSNAVKYSEPGGEIRTEVSEEGEAIHCSVYNDGPGIPVEDQAKLFSRGARLEARPTGGEASHGYGLAVAKELIEGLNGVIWCESEPGKGARFCFRVPVSDQS